MIYYIESLGAFIGGLAFSFILVDRMNPMGIIFILISLAIFITFFKRDPRFLALLILPLILMIYSNRIEFKIYKYVWDKSHIGELIEYKRTRYQLIEVESYDNTVSVYGDGILMYTLPDRYETRGLFHLIQSLKHKGYKKILLLGGPGSLLYNLSKSNIDLLYYFELDPDLWFFIKPYVNTYYGSIDNKIIIINQDLKRFLTYNKMRFDMIIILAPQPENIILNRFYTQDFYSQCKKHKWHIGFAQRV